MLTKEAIVTHYPNGQLEWRVPIEWHVYGHYRRHGEALQYYPSGEVKLHRTYEHGVEVGTETIYYKNGSVMSTLNFTNGKKEGVHIFNHPDGSREECSFASGELARSSIKHFDEKGKEKLRTHEPDSKGPTELKKILPGDHIPSSFVK